MKAASVFALLAYGALAVLISPPFHWIVLQPVAWVPAYGVFSRLRGGRALFVGWGVGFAVNLGLFYWLANTAIHFFELPVWAAPLALAGFCLLYGFYVGLFAWGFGAIRRGCGGWWPFGIAAWYTACEFLNPQFFPYTQGSAWGQVPSLFLITSLTGVSGVTFLVMLCNGLVLQALESRGRLGRGPARRALLRNLGVALAVFAFVLVWSQQRLARIEAAEARAESIRIALVQTNLYGEARKRLMATGKAALGEDLVSLSRRAVREHGPIDVFVWPEGALGAIPRSKANESVLAFVRETGSEVWTGASFRTRERGGRSRSFNSAFRIHADGRVERRYDKNVLVPLGEYVPFAALLARLHWTPGRGHHEPGQELIVYESERARFAFLICYEAILSRYVRNAFREPLDLLVNISFDAWFGDTSAPHQHLLLSAAQAAQFGVPLVRSTTSGISAFVDARGVVTARSGLFTREVLVRDVKKVRVPTLYAAFGDWFAWFCVVVSFGLLVRSRRHSAIPADRNGTATKWTRSDS